MKKVLPLVLAVLLIHIALFSSAQQLKTLKPELGAKHDFSKTEYEYWQKAMTNYNNMNQGKLDYDKLTDEEKKALDSLENENGPITTMGCSWYCGGDVKKTSSDAVLKPQDGNTYTSANAHDFNLLTAWVPNATGGTIGKKINFHFDATSAAFNSIIIYNGYIKNQESWAANARVKKFKLYINNKPSAILELQDVTASQTFSLPSTKSTVKGKDLVLTLEIMEVYPGAKYNDVAVSEINFDGPGGH
jgi:hypothetical protein